MTDLLQDLLLQAAFLQNEKGFQMMSIYCEKKSCDWQVSTVDMATGHQLRQHLWFNLPKFSRLD